MCCSSEWLLVTSKKVIQWMPPANPHVIPKGCSLPAKLSAFQPGLSVRNLSLWPEKLVELFWIILNWRLKASHNQMARELGLTEKQNTWNDFGLNPQRTEYCAYTFSWISSKFRLLPGSSLSPSPPLAKFLGVPPSRPPDVSATL